MIDDLIFVCQSANSGQAVWGGETCLHIVNDSSIVILASSDRYIAMAIPTTERTDYLSSQRWGLLMSRSDNIGIENPRGSVARKSLLLTANNGEVLHYFLVTWETLLNLETAVLTVAAAEVLKRN
jgi:hypothetical protein